MEHVYLRLIAKYGYAMQQDIAIEEMSELIKAIIKLRRKEIERKVTTLDVEHIAEEIADVEIMLEQLKIIHNCQYLVTKFKQQKNERLTSLI